MQLVQEKHSAQAASAPALVWPEKYDVFGVHISATTYISAADAMLNAARRRKGGLVTALAVHGVVESSTDEKLGNVVNQYDMVTPDGQPVRIALNVLHNSRLASRVAGPDLMLLLCERCEATGMPIYLYGSTEFVVETLRDRLVSRFPYLKVAGCEPSLFRPITPAESQELADRINASGAGIVFIGLGCPLQEKFAFQHRSLIQPVQFCVGAAFDFHAGLKRRAPQWMRDFWLEWFFRMMQEPGRLWKRYLVTNTLFIVKFVQQWMTQSDSSNEEMNAVDRATE
ncbi:WecB/TagA/CpsF family glycosyltransferase [soil metagenome]